MTTPPAEWNEEVAKLLLDMDKAYGELSSPDDRRRAASIVVIGMMDRLDRLPLPRELEGSRSHVE